MLNVCLDDSPRFTWIEMREVDSTNTFLRAYSGRNAGEGHLTVVTAEHQLKGRGQAGNTWESEDGRNLRCSFLFTPPESVSPSESFIINQAVALAARDACQEFLGDTGEDEGRKVEVKWPNDIYVNGRKIGGILIETEMTGTRVKRVIAGIGINVNQTEWQFASEPLPHPTPTSLSLLAGGETLVRNVLEQLVGHLQRRLAQLARVEYERIREDYISHLYRREGVHRYKDENGEFEARIAGIEETGHLVLKDTEGEVRRYAFKEVAFLG